MINKILAFIITFIIIAIRIVVAGYMVGDTIENYKGQHWFICGVDFVLSIWCIYGLLTDNFF